MISENIDRKILYVPSDFLTSERYYHARTSMAAGINDIRGYTLKNWFLDRQNVDYITKQMFDVYLNNDYKYKSQNEPPLTYPFFVDRVPKWMDDYADSEEIERYVEEPEAVITSDYNQLYKYYIMGLSKINKEFFLKYYYLIKKVRDDELPGLTGKPDWNPYKASATMGTKNEFEDTMHRGTLYDLIYSYDDFRNMDVWKQYDIERWNKNYRYRNEIPVWQNLNKNRIRLDRSNDGLHDGNPDRASLDNLQRGYNMDDIYKYTSLQYNQKNQWTGV
jgi:hypothetical protein